eukprot:gene31529-6714_t
MSNNKADIMAQEILEVINRISHHMLKQQCGKIPKDEHYQFNPKEFLWGNTDAEVEQNCNPNKRKLEADAPALLAAPPVWPYNKVGTHMTAHQPAQVAPGLQGGQPSAWRPIGQNTTSGANVSTWPAASAVGARQPSPGATQGFDQFKCAAKGAPLTPPLHAQSAPQDEQRPNKFQKFGAR